MSLDETADQQQVLGEDEEEVLASISAELDRCCQQPQLEALQEAGELLKRETNGVRTARNIVEAQSKHQSNQITFICFSSYSTARFHSAYMHPAHQKRRHNYRTILTPRRAGAQCSNEQGAPTAIAALALLRAGSRVERIDPLRFVAGCRKKATKASLSACLLAYF